MKQALGDVTLITGVIESRKGYKRARRMFGGPTFENDAAVVFGRLHFFMKEDGQVPTEAWMRQYVLAANAAGIWAAPLTEDEVEQATCTGMKQIGRMYEAWHGVSSN